jgi:3-methyladenine DNA glycosylase/8-oxoguanine DNA glycosylase
MSLSGRSGDEAYWRRYFDLDRDYEEIARRCGDARARAAFSAARGISCSTSRLWETLCAFIVSANNNDKASG